MENVLTFAIGDVHGCVDKLQGLLAACDSVRAGHDARYVLVGDYIDRGPHSRDVVDFLMHRQRSDGGRLVCLRGTHEQMLLEGPATGRTVPDLLDGLSDGGEETLH